MIETLDSVPQALVYAIIAVIIVIHIFLLSTRKNPLYGLIVPGAFVVTAVYLVIDENSFNAISGLIVFFGLLALWGLGRGIRSARIKRENEQIELKNYRR